MAIRTVPGTIDPNGVQNTGVALNDWFNSTVLAGDTVNFPVFKKFRNDDLQSLDIQVPNVTVNGNGSWIFRTDPQVNNEKRAPYVRLVQIIGTYGVTINALYGRGAKTQSDSYNVWHNLPYNANLESHHFMTVNGGGSHTINNCAAFHFMGDAFLAQTRGSGKNFPASTTATGLDIVVVNPANTDKRCDADDVGRYCTAPGLPDNTYVSAYPYPGQPDNGLTFKVTNAAGVGAGVGAATLHSDLVYDLVIDGLYGWDLARHFITPQGFRPGRPGIDLGCSRLDPNGEGIGIWVKNCVGLYYQHHWMDPISDVDYPNEPMGPRFGQSPNDNQNNDGDARDNAKWGGVNECNEALGIIPRNGPNEAAYPFTRAHIPAQNLAPHPLAALMPTNPNQVPAYAPTIVAVAVEGTTANTADLRWRSDHVIVSTKVSYSLTKVGTGLGPPITVKTTGIVLDLDDKRATTTLTGLQPSTEYWFVPEVTNAIGATDITNAQTFFTLAGNPPPVRPIIDNVVLVGTTTTTAHVTFTTTAPAIMISFYTTAGVRVQGPTLPVGTSHDLTFTGLTPNTVYILELGAWNANGTDQHYLLATTGTPPPAGPHISNLALGTITPTSIVVTWDLDSSANATSQFARVGGAAATGPTAAAATSHSLTFTGLEPASDYTFFVGSTNGNGFDNAFILGTTAAAPINRPVLTNIRSGIITSTSIQVLWTSTPAGDGTTAYFDDVTDTLVPGPSDASGLEHDITITGLTPSTVYPILVGSTNGSGSTTSGLTATTGGVGGPTDGPIITNVEVTPGFTNILVEWSTDVSADSSVNYATEDEYNLTGELTAGPTDATLTTEHSLLITELDVDTAYVVQGRSDNGVLPTAFLVTATTEGDFVPFTFAGRYGPEALRDSEGNSVPNEPVTVYETGTLTLATLYTTSSKSTGAANPVSSDSTGLLAFYAEPGQYDLLIGSTTISDVTVPINPLEDQFSFIGLDATDAEQTYALPVAADVSGFRIAIKKVDSSANTVTVISTGTDTIDGDSARVLSSQYAVLDIVSDGLVWQVVNSGGGSGPPAGTPSLRFTTTPQTTTTGVATGTITIERLDGSGAPDVVGTLVLGLGPSGGTSTFLATDGVTEITSVTIASGETTASFKYENTVAGSVVVNVSASGYNVVTQQLEILAGAALPTKLVFLSAPQDLLNGELGPTMTVQLQDAAGVPVNTVGARTINLASTSGGKTFRNVADTADITSVSMTDGTNTVSFRYKDTVGGTPTLTASDASAGATVTLDGTSPVVVALQTTVAAGSNGVNVSTFAGAGTLNVASTTGFYTSGTLIIGTTSTPGAFATITYTGLTGTTFTGCANAGGALAMTTGMNVSGNRCMTASFTPPAGSFIVARVAGNGYPQPVTITLGDSFGLTWTKLAEATVNPQRAAIWGASCPTSQAMTVNATRTLTSYGGFGFSMKVDVFTGTEAAWGGAKVTGGGASLAPSATITTTRNSSMILAVTETSSGNAQAPGTNLSETNETTLAGFLDVWFGKYTTSPAVGTYTLNTTMTSSDWHLAAIELRPGAGAITSGTQPVTIAAGQVSTTSQKSADNFFLHGGDWNMYIPAAYMNGTAPGGPNTPGGNQIFKSMHIGGHYLTTDNWAAVGGTVNALGQPDAQRQMVTSGLNTRVRAVGGKWYLGFYLFDNASGPNRKVGGAPYDITGTGEFKNFTGPAFDWFSTTRKASFITQMGNAAAAAKRLGASGLFFDAECYGCTMHMNYNGAGTAGATATHAQRKAKVREWGVAMGQAIATNFPGCEIALYNSAWIPGGTYWKIGDQSAGIGYVGFGEDWENQLMHSNLWDGVFDAAQAGMGGIGNFYGWNFNFAQGPYGGPDGFADLDTEYWFDFNHKYAWFSRNIANWKNMASKVFLTGFVGASSGDGTLGYKPKSAASRGETWGTARRWNMGGQIPLWSPGAFPLGPVPPATSFNFTTGVHSNGLPLYQADGAPNTNYRPALNSTAAPGVVVQNTPPTFSNLSVTRPGGGANPVVVTGRCQSHGITGAVNTVVDGAIRQVKWSSPSGGSGVCQMTLVYSGPSAPIDPTSWYQSFTFSHTMTAGNTITLTAEDTHLNTTVNTSLTAP